ncbi:hypothetical protein CCAX7_36560 [Capsulimonas corticalis]|uniref:Uncharacterized protein n=1 Tax=Capsulimonas corticalis TaxID=2219043 RepID=A0A402D1H2_9BACT|nr:hypothetical protein [Capsulimonas corticalis]BDI31605.1 hypothetical protein CCAX7_36560 [Capsulimonas corticalis]
MSKSIRKHRKSQFRNTGTAVLVATALIAPHISAQAADAPAPAEAPAAAPAPTPPAAADLATLATETKAAQDAYNIAKIQRDAAKAVIAAMPAATPDLDATANTIDKLGGAAKALTTIPQVAAKDINALNGALVAYSAAPPADEAISHADALTKAAAVVSTGHNLTAAQQAAVDNATTIVKDIKALQADITTSIVGVDAKTILLTKVAGGADYATALVASLDGNLSALTTHGVAIYSDDFLKSTDIPTLRDGLVVALKPIYDEEQRRVLLTQQASAFFKAAATNASSSNYDAAIAKLKPKVLTIIPALPTMPALIVTDLNDHANKLDQLTAKVKEQLKLPPDVRKIPETANEIADARTAIDTCRTIVSSWIPLNKLWTAQGVAMKDANTAIAVNLDSAQTNEAASLLRLSDALAGDVQNFVQDQVSLYYFTDVPRIVKALNTSADIFNKDATNGPALVRKTRDALTQADADLAGQIAAINDLRARKQAVIAEIQQVNATAAAQTRRAALAQAEYDRVTKQEAAISTQLQNTTLTQAVKDNLTAQDNDLKAQQTAQGAVRDAAQTAATQAAQDKQSLQDEQSALPLKLQVATDTLHQAQITVAATRKQNEILAQQASDAFVDFRDNTPYYFAPADVSSNDPAHRVIIFAYPDSKTIFLRGLQSDIDDVKEMIAGFDKPAPQARISLWSMQLNGSNTNKMNNALFWIDSTLRDLRGNLTLVQDLLRDSVNAEVNHVEAITYEATHQAYDYLKTNDSKTGLPLSPPLDNSETSQGLIDRLARYYYYPDEIRKALGYPVDIPADTEHLATALVDFRLARDYYAKARYSDIAANEIKDKAKKSRYEAAREQSLRRGGMYFQHALDALEMAPRQRHYLVKEFTIAPWDTFTCAKEIDCLKERAAEIAQLIHSQANSTAYDNIFELKSGHRDELADQWATVRVPERETLVERKFDEIIWALHHRLGVRCEENPDGIYVPEDRLTASDDDCCILKTLPQGDQLASLSRLTRLTLPDPARGTTLGEILFELSLGKRRSRENILRNFLLELNDAYPNSAASNSQVALRSFIDDLGAQYGDEQVLGTGLHSNGSTGAYPSFPRTIFGALATRVPSEDNNHEMTSNQLEILSALQVKVRASAAMEVRRILRQISDIPNTVPDKTQASQLLRLQYIPLVGWLNEKQIASQNKALSAKILPGDWFNKGLEVLSAGASHTPPLDQSNFVALGTDVAHQFDQNAWELTKLTWQRNALSSATPRVAAADDMIKRMIIVAEDDLDHYFVQPALWQLQYETHISDVQFGVIQRESLLCTNRLVARLDPSATANPQLPADDNVLDSAQQLGQIAQQYIEDQRAAKLNVTVPFAIGGLSNIFTNISKTNAWRLAGVVSLLGDLAAQPQQPKGEIYSVNTGNMFQVTPIFDPSGQALRFKFDFIASTRLTEPDGTVSAQIPRVERHAVNTEVQLTNLEFREISRFQANSQVGVPEQKAGGIPGLNRLPLLKDLPIIGYFTRTGGVKSTQQESLIFAQTSIYPTVGDIVGLLTDENPREDIDPRAPLDLQPPTAATPDPEKAPAPLIDPLVNTMNNHININHPVLSETVINHNEKTTIYNNHRTIIKGRTLAPPPPAIYGK